VSSPAPDSKRTPTGEPLALMQIRRVIFHDVPRKIKQQEQTPVVSEVESPIDSIKVVHLRNKLIKVLTGSGAYELEVVEQAESSIPGLVKSILIDESTFVWASQAMAVALLEQQTGSSPEGLLTVIDCIVSGRPAVAILKVQREAGAQLTLGQHDGKKTFEMAVLGDSSPAMTNGPSPGRRKWRSFGRAFLGVEYEKHQELQRGSFSKRRSTSSTT